MIPLNWKKASRDRPSPRECWKKLAAARKHVETGEWIAANAGHLQDSFDELATKFGTETTSREDQTKLLIMAFKEVKAEHYFGAFPPEQSIELATRDLDLWIFKWKSEAECFGKSIMYLKFCVVGAGRKGPVFIHSIHPDNPPQ